MEAFQVLTCECISVWGLQGKWLDRAVGSKAHIHKVPHRAFRHSGKYALVVKAMHINLQPMLSLTNAHHPAANVVTHECLDEPHIVTTVLVQPPWLYGHCLRKHKR